MAIQIYTITNYSPSIAAVVRYVTINTTLTEMQHSLDLTGWNEPFNSSYTSFTGQSTLLTSTKTYVSDVRPIDRTYVSITGTYIRVAGGTVSGIGTGWAVQGDQFTSGQTVLGTSGTTWVYISALPDSTPPPSSAIRFNPPNYLLTLDSITGIGEGWAASGAGYSNQTVISTSTGVPNTIEMSGYSSLTSPSGNITFTSAGDTMLYIPPLSSSTFKMNYTRVTSSYGTYASKVFFHIEQGTNSVRNVDNFMFVSSAPVVDPSSPFYDGGGGGSASAGTCGDSASASCSASGAAGGGSCFTGNTLITLYDGRKVPIADLKIHDVVLDALTGRPNKVIGIKTIMSTPGMYLFSPRDGVEPFITEEHPFYNDQGELCAISAMAETLAPWLGTIKVVDVKNKVQITDPIPVYNLMLETGNTHYANDVPVNNIVGTGNTYVLLYKGYIDYETYINNNRNLDKQLQTRESLLFYHRVFKFLTDYVLYHDNVISKMIGKFGAHQLTNRDKVKKYWDAVAKNPIGKLLRKIV